jgi:hypothetical protein
MKRHDTVSYVLLAVILAFIVWTAVEPFPVPGWAVVAFVFVVLFPMAIVISVKRARTESRLMRTVLKALTGR